MSTKYSLITGVCGGVGAALALDLLSKEKHVLGIDNFLTGSSENLEILQKNKQFAFLHLSCEQACQITFPIAEIYHLACPTGVPNLEPLALQMLSATSTGTRAVLDLALRHKAPFVLASSSEVYGDPQIFPQTETYTGHVDSLGVRSPYEEGKRFSESLVAAYVRTYSLNACIARIFNTYGPYFPMSDTRVITQFLRCAKQNAPLCIHGDGSQLRTFLHSNDLVQGLILLMEKGKAGRAYNIGSATQTSILDLAKQVIAITSSKSVITHTDRPAHDHSARLPDLGRVQELGWKQTLSLEEGIAQLC